MLTTSVVHELGHWAMGVALGHEMTISLNEVAPVDRAIPARDLLLIAAALAQGGGILLGIDDWLAHVQPDGTYHYHGIPDRYLTNQPGRHGPLFGWAGDGFPIYLRAGYVDPEDPSTGVEVLMSS